MATAATNGYHHDDCEHHRGPAAVQPQRWTSLLLQGLIALVSVGLFWLLLSGGLYLAADAEDPFQALEASPGPASAPPPAVLDQNASSQGSASSQKDHSEPEEIVDTSEAGLLTKLRSEAIKNVLKGGFGAVLLRILSLSEVTGLECGEDDCDLYVTATLGDAEEKTQVTSGTSSFDWDAAPVFLPLPASFLTSEARVKLEVMSQSSKGDVSVSSADVALESVGAQVATPLQLETQSGILKLQFAYAYLTLGGVAPPAPEPEHEDGKGGGEGDAKVKSSKKGSPPANYTFLGTWRQKYDEHNEPLVAKAVAQKKGSRKGKTISIKNYTNHSEPRFDPIDPDYELWAGDDPVNVSAVIQQNFTPRAHSKRGQRAPSGVASDPECVTLCQNKVKDKGCWPMIAGAMGRLGNRLSEMMHSVYQMNMTGIRPGLEMQPGFISVIWDFPTYICVGRPKDFNFTARKVKECLGHANKDHEYDSPCKKDMSWQYVELSRRYLVPYFSESMKECLNAPRDLDEDRLLTIHLRGEDIFGVHVDAHEYEKEPYWAHAAAYRMTEQPPCPFYKKLLNDGNFTRVLIITSQDLANPCVEWLNMHRKNLTNSRGELVKMELQTGTLEQDACAILKARQIAPSHSSMLHNLIVVAAAMHPVGVYMVRRAFDPHWLLGCSARAANVTFQLYAGTHTKRGPTNPISGLPVPHVLNAALDWLVNFPEGSLRALTTEEQNC